MKVLASDFDNTLFFRNIENGFYQEDIEAIQSFQQKGHLFGLCSGRPFSGLLKPLKGILKPDFFIASTGSLIYDKDLKLLFAQKVPFEIVDEIYETYADETDLIVQTDSFTEFFCTNPTKDEKKDVVEIFSVKDMKDKNIYSISLVHSTVDRARIITQQINEKYEEVDAYQNVDSIDILAKGCSKGNAIIRLKELLNLKSVGGIGDSYNDLPMLNCVDTSFTFQKSPKDIQNQVNHVVNNIAQAIQILEEEEYGVYR